MDKKVLVSILAMTSASTMTAWADANVDKLKTDDLKDWTNGSEESNLKLEDGVIVSPDGADIIKTINLAPGTYKLSAGTLTNAKILFGDTELTKAEDADHYTFAVEGDELRDVTLTFKAIEESELRIGGLTLTLDYDFNAARKVLEAQLTDAINKIVEGDEEATKLSEEASEIASRLKLLVDNTEGAYQAYVDNEMWKGTDACKFAGQIKAVDEKAGAQGANMSAYQAALDAIKEQQEALAAVNATLASYETAYTNGTYEYAQGITEGMPAAAQTIIDNYQAKADKAHQEGNAAEVLTEDDIKAFTEGASKAISEFSALVESAPVNHEAYLYINEKVSALKAQEEKALQEIYKKLTDDPDVYEDSRKEAQNELNAVLVKIVEIENKNVTEENHQKSEALRDANEVALGEGEGSLEQEISDIQDKWTTAVDTWEKAYADALKKTAEKQDLLDEKMDIPAIQEKHSETTETIQGLINTLSEKIEADYKAHTIVKNGYKSDLKEIQDALDKLDDDAADDIANYDAYQLLLKQYTDAQKKLEEAKETIKNIKEEHPDYPSYSYSTEGRYEYTKLTADLEAIKNKIDDDYEAGECDVEKNYGFGEFNGNVVAFIKNATLAKDQHVKIQVNLNYYTETLKKLTDKVTNKEENLNIPVTGKEPGTTYGTEIQRLQGIIDDIQEKFDEANTKKDEAYHEALSAIVTDDNFPETTDFEAEVDALCDSYDTDKKAYDDALIEKAIATIINESNKVIADAETLLEGIDLNGTLDKDNVDTEETKGLTTRKAELEKRVEEQSDIVNADYKAVENKSEVYEILFNAKTEIDKIKAEIDTLKTDVEKSKKAFQANEEKYAGLSTSLDGLAADIQNVRESYKDDNRSDEFEGEPDGIATKLQKTYEDLEAAIDGSYKDQTLVEKSKDVTPEEGETILGFDSRVTALTEDIAEAQELAEACAANRAAYDETDAYRKNLKIGTAISNARKEIKYNENWGTYEGARTYYKNLLTGYSKENTQLTDSIGFVYEEERASVAKKEAFKESLDALLANVNAVPGLVTNNNQGYDEMCGIHAAILKTWTETYADITANDESSKQQEYLEKLTAIKSDLTMAKASIEEHFNGGLYGPAESEELVADRAELQRISTELSTLKNDHSTGYKALIDADNLNRHNEFLDSLAITRTYWRTSVEIVEQYKSLKDESLREAAGTAATTASTALNEILSELNTIQTEELTEYEKIRDTEEADLFDKTESFKGQVTVQYNEIAGTMKTLDDAVYAAAQDLLGDKLGTAEQACADALVAIQGITEEDTQEAVLAAATDYSIAQGYVDEAKEANGEGKDFALVVEKCLENLAKVDSLLASAKEQAADKEWELYYGKTSEKKAEQEKDLDETFNLTLEARNQYKEEYANAWKENDVDMFTDLYNQAKEEDLFSKISGLKSSLDTYADKATEVYNKANAESENNKANEAAYDDKLQEIAGLRGNLEKAVNYAEAYATFYLESVQTYISVCKGLIATAEAGLEEAYKNADSQNYVVDESIAGRIEGLYFEAIGAEQRWLNTQAIDLDGEYNNAYAKDPVAAQALETTKKELQKAITEYKWADNDGTPIKKTDEIQKDLLAFETSIASLRSQLLEISAPGSEAAIVEELNGMLDDVKTSYDEMQGLLEERDLTNEDLNAVGNTIAEIQGKIDASEAVPGQILLNQPAIEKAICEVKTELEGLTGKIEELAAKYDANKAAYEKLSAQIAENKAELEAAKTAIEALTTIEQDAAADGISDISTAIEGEETDLKDLYDQMELTAESTVEDFSDAIATLLKDYTYKENSNLIETLLNAIDDIQTALLQASNVMNKAQLQNDVDALQTSAENLQKYNNDAQDGTVTRDIYGNVIDETTVDYVGAANPVINETLNTLNGQLNDLKQTIEDNTYVLGDADGDGMVQVTDYMQLMKYILGTESVEEGTVTFMRADANQDGRINNGDLVTVVNKILGIRTVDALEQVLATNSMESVGEVRMAAVEGMASKKIAIQLCSTNKYAACQMDVNIPAGVTVTSSSVEGLQNHSLYSAEQADGTLRLVVSSLENAVMDTEGNATIYLEVEGNNAEAITVSNVTAADVAGATYNVVDKGEATGINGVTSKTNTGSLKQRIYSVGGQMMDSVKKGINIITNSDGTARKVLKK